MMKQDKMNDLQKILGDVMFDESVSTPKIQGQGQMSFIPYTAEDYITPGQSRNQLAPVGLLLGPLEKRGMQ